MFDDNPNTDFKQEISTGTSIIAVSYNGGILIGADSRTSSGTYVTDRVADKLEYIHDRIYCLCSGSAADTRILAKAVRYNLQMHSMELGTLPQVKSVARLYQNMMYQYKDQLMASLIVIGWDEVNGSQIYTIPPGGSVVQQKFAIGGSGSGFIYGFCDANFRPNFELEEAKTFVKQSLGLAMRRDGSSGGIIRLVNINKDAVTREFVNQQDVPFINK